MLNNGLDVVINCSIIAQLHAVGKRVPLGPEEEREPILENIAFHIPYTSQVK